MCPSLVLDEIARGCSLPEPRQHACAGTASRRSIHGLPRFPGPSCAVRLEEEQKTKPTASAFSVEAVRALSAFWCYGRVGTPFWAQVRGNDAGSSPNDVSSTPHSLMVSMTRESQRASSSNGRSTE